ncbi:hypothetical protein D3C84_937860 [compost metagenome]
MPLPISWTMTLIISPSLVAISESAKSKQVSEKENDARSSVSLTRGSTGIPLTFTPPVRRRKPDSALSTLARIALAGLCPIKSERPAPSSAQREIKKLSLQATLPAFRDFTSMGALTPAQPTRIRSCERGRITSSTFSRSLNSSGVKSCPFSRASTTQSGSTAPTTS